jgi:hypothetical protein
MRFLGVRCGRCGAFCHDRQPEFTRLVHIFRRRARVRLCNGRTDRKAPMENARRRSSGRNDHWCSHAERNNTVRADFVQGGIYRLGLALPVLQLPWQSGGFGSIDGQDLVEEPYNHTGSEGWREERSRCSDDGPVGSRRLVQPDRRCGKAAGLPPGTTIRIRRRMAPT